MDANQKLDQLNEKVDRITTALLGDEKMGVEGLVSKVKKHEDELGEYDKLKHKGAGILAAVAVAAGIVVHAIEKFIESLMTK
jgi:hypothetical protein